MLCPFCRKAHLNPTQHLLYFGSDLRTGCRTRKCPACGKVAVWKDNEMLYPNPTFPPNQIQKVPRAAAEKGKRMKNDKRSQPRKKFGSAYLKVSLSKDKTLHGYLVDTDNGGIGMKTL